MGAARSGFSGFYYLCWAWLTLGWTFSAARLTIHVWFSKAPSLEVAAGRGAFLLHPLCSLSQASKTFRKVDLV